MLKRDLQGTWTCTLVDIPKVTVRRLPAEEASQVSWFPCLTDTDANCVSPPPPMQVTTKKRLAVAKGKRGPLSALRRMYAVLQRQHIAQSAANKRPVLASCPGKSCRGQCSQGVNCKGARPPAARHHLILDPEDLVENKRKCILLDHPPSNRRFRFR